MGKQKTDLLQGTLDMLILKALSHGPMHGYGVGQRIMQLAEEMLRVEEGSLYPALAFLPPHPTGSQTTACRRRELAALCAGDR